MPDENTKNGVNVNLILEILSLAAKYGLPVVQSAIETSHKQMITPSDIEDLMIQDEENWEDFWE